MTRECSADDLGTAENLILELLRTALSLSDAFTALVEDLPEDAFPEEDPAEVLLEMMAGSSLPAVEAAGRDLCGDATGLIVAVRERIIDDLRAAAQLAKRDDEVLL